VETRAFLRRADDCGVSEEERAEIVLRIAKGGDPMPGTGGARKIRFAPPGQGKRGGYRVITFYSGEDIPVFLLSMFAKNEKSDMSPAEKNELKKILKIFAAELQEGEEMSKNKATTKAGQSILEGAREALAFARGEKNHGCIVHVPEGIDVKAIRRQAHMSQSEFSRSYGFSKRSLEQWEQGRRAPTGAARVFLTVIAREPEAVQRALSEPRSN